ncbi:MAG: M14 family metallopeptidase, partial [Bacteroidia bacterium]
MKKLFVIAFAFFFFQIGVFAQQKYSRVKVYTGDSGMTILAAAGVAVDHGEYRKGKYFIGEFSAKEIDIIRTKGFKYDILIDDMESYYLKRNEQDQKQLNKTQIKKNENPASALTYPTPSNFTLGSMGGFYTYSEALTHLDNMVSKWPNLVKMRIPIDTFHSLEGRPIYWMRISNNPNVDQMNKPQILFTALHHAREPASLSQLIMFMYYLLENYTINSEIKYFVDNTEIYFVPIVNPDGYIYNQTTNPNGGGMWRKNKRVLNGVLAGVDLNRNYGNNWGYDNIGSSNNSSMETFRGMAPFSEPETQAMRAFCNAHQFKIAVNYHTYGNDLIYPYGYIANHFTPDSNYFSNLAAYMTEENNYVFGTVNQTLGYLTNGDSDDWMYGEQNSKPKIFSLTPETGTSSDGFWPQISRIVDVSKANIGQNIRALRALVDMALLNDVENITLTPKNKYIHYT